MNFINYKINTATTENIEEHLIMCSKLFTPPLDTYVNISDYSLKLRKQATTIEAWSDKILVGLVACYLNNENTYYGYISNVSVSKKFIGSGLAKKLLENTIKYANKKKFMHLELEVKFKNIAAINLYQKIGFTIKERFDDYYKMGIDTKNNILRIPKKKSIGPMKCNGYLNT